MQQYTSETIQSFLYNCSNDREALRMAQASNKNIKHMSIFMVKWPTIDCILNKIHDLESKGNYEFVECFLGDNECRIVMFETMQSLEGLLKVNEERLQELKQSIADYGNGFHTQEYMTDLETREKDKADRLEKQNKERNRIESEMYCPTRSNY